MTLTEEVLLFSQEYISSRKQRTFVRKGKIRRAYKELTGKDVNGSCSTCYIEALFEIIDLFKPNTEKMAHCRYSLKAGVLLQAFGDASKTCTNANLTDELAEWHLRNNPGVSKYFSVMPGDVPQVAQGIPIVAPSAPPRIMEIVPPVIIKPIIPPVTEREKVLAEMADAIEIVKKLQEKPDKTVEKEEAKEIINKPKRKYPSRKNK